MQDRGVSRPTMKSSHRNNSNSNDSSSMNSEVKREAMLHEHHQKTLWVYWLIIILGIWLILSPLTFDYGLNPVSPSGDRHVWLSLSKRIVFSKWSDIISGILLVGLGWRSLSPNRPYSLWACCFVGIWISFAPILFWAPSPLIYMNDTFVGALIIALTVLIPGMPNMILYMKMGTTLPEGWSYNPSSWPQRWIMIVTGIMGWFVSRYLAAYQLGYNDHMWDPFFGDGSVHVLNSAMSHSLPISDAGLGSLAYTFEFLMGFMGSPSRWRTMPWMVTLFGILVIPLGLVHIFLVISQPVVVGNWCTFCLLAAAIMLPMIPLEIDEVIAMGQHLVKTTRRGENFWKVFWKGGQAPATEAQDKSIQLEDLPQRPWQLFKASIRGMSFPWTLIVSLLLGIELMFAPAIFNVNIATMGAHVNHLGGSLIVVTSAIAMGEVVRIGRYFNFILGIALLVSIFVFHESWPFTLNTIAVGCLVVFLSIAKGNKLETYGMWDKYVR